MSGLIESTISLLSLFCFVCLHYHVMTVNKIRFFFIRQQTTYFHL